MGIRVGNVVFDAPFAGSLEQFGRAAGSIADLYAALLGMEKRARADMLRAAGYPADAGDEVDPLLSPGEHDGIGIAFEFQSEGYEPPRWPDPAYPQQIHLDIFVRELDSAETVVREHGATKLRDGQQCRTFADAVGHPFCLYEERERMSDHPAPGRIGRIVLDCPDPSALCDFYEDLLGLGDRVESASDRVVIGWRDGRLPMFAFQQSPGVRPRWPDPAFPEQVHLDLGVDDQDELEAARSRALRLGATELYSGLAHHVYADPAGHPFCM